MESLPNSSDNSIGLPATLPQSTTLVRAPTPPLDIDYNSSTASEEVDSSPPSPVMKLASRPCSPEPNYSSDPETVPSYSPVPEAEEHAFRLKVVYYDGPHETTQELLFKFYNRPNPDMQRLPILINGSENKPWEYFRAVTKEDLHEFGKSHGVSNPSYPELIPEFLQWYPMLILRYLNDKFFQQILTQAKNFGQGYCKESVFSPISYHAISAYLLTFTPFLQRYNCVMT